MELRTVIVVNDPDQAGPILECLARKGFSGIVESDPEKALEGCRINPPALVIAEDRLQGITGTRFLSELVRISWKTSTVLVVNEEEEVVHQRTEGLGILGHIRDCEDTASMEKLLDKMLEIRRLTE